MADARRRHRLAPKTIQRIAVLGQLRVEAFHGDPFVRRELDRLVDTPEAALAEHSGQAIRAPDRLADSRLRFRADLALSRTAFCTHRARTLPQIGVHTGREVQVTIFREAPSIPGKLWVVRDVLIHVACFAPIASSFVLRPLSPSS